MPNGGKLGWPDHESGYQLVDRTQPYRTPCQRKADPQRELPPGGEDYSWPPRDEEAVYESFGKHLDLVRPARLRARRACVNRGALARVEKTYRKVRAHYELETPEGEEKFKRILGQLNHKGSTGLGQFSRFSTIGDALGWDGIQCTNDGQVNVLRECLRRRLEELSKGPGGQCDLKVFVKDEPTSRKKVKAGRYRLIFCFDLVDQVVDRWLFTEMVEDEIETHEGSRIGWSPLPYWADYVHKMKSPTLATDCSAFDWTYPCAIAMQLAGVRAARVDADEHWSRVIANRYAEVLGPYCRVRMPNGLVLQQTGWGFMKSGWFLTISDNSFCQLVLVASAALDIGIRPPYTWAMGDDVIMTWRHPGREEDMVRALEAYGVIIKHHTPEPEFAGFRISRGTRRYGPSVVVDPLYPQKHAFVLRHASDADLQELVDAYAVVYAARDQSKSCAVARFVESRTSLNVRVLDAWADNVPGVGCI
uniref:Putative replicase n=1 Tax=Nufsystermes virus TaxID=2796621 RepID=A0A894KQ42_9VIRU|nr:putative replicase [Nufsystermes virus]QRW42895.1 putative replicase [Nufsystermes virus]